MVPILRILRAAGGPDRDLLDRYVRHRDEEAFEALVRRYGTGVWAACVRLAGRDAEDAFQAVFLILSRKAGTVTGSLPAWLHAVTRRVAANLWRNARRRSEVEAAVRPRGPLTDDPSLREGLALLDEELARLPERYRAVLIVCCLTARKEIEALRKRVEALEGVRKPAAAEHWKVVVSNPTVKDVVLSQRYVGQVRAHRHINVCALTSGIVSEVAAKEGQAVKQGDVLFKVLPTLSKARLDAELAEVRIAQLELNNTRKLFEQKVITQQEVALAEAKLAKVQARAKLAEAELNFTVVRAPFDGLIGRLREQAGSVVKEGAPLTTLSDNSVMWVYFNVPEARYLEYAAHPDQVKVGAPVELVLANGEKFPQPGRLAAIEGQFQSDTGTIPFRADFPNPKGLLRHGQTGTVLLSESLKGALLIPQRATFEDGGKQYVYLLGKDDVAHRRETVVAHELENLFVVKKGLSVNDRIVVDGARQLRDGEKVEGYEYRKPEEVMGTPKTRPGK